MHNIIVVLVSVLVGLALSVFVLALTLGITIPFVGVLVRYRANYTPKTGAVRLDDEAGPGAAPRADASIGYFGMMKRVHRLEGWAGLYKGIMPTLITSLIAVVVVAPVSVVLLQFQDPTAPRPHFSLVPWTVGFGLSVIPALLLVPMQIITNRAMTTPHKLAAFAPRAALRVLLSPAERAQPLRLYLAPGVALAIALETLIAPLPNVLRLATTGSLALVLGTAVPAVVLTTALVTPLEVLTARLTLQRRPGAAPAEMDAVVVPLYSTEPVIEFRESGADAEEAPYTGLLDCARKIVAEEGWGVLTRAWWLTALGVLLTLGTPEMIPRPPPVF
ncbi:hypothetical protein B0H12DRAFT_1146655 [Mycena haematopus]|nr:hypothetical protein B0H12DRAFT_1146655 [Mycena haematopus]